eukprot:3568571-Rhodomonas_salina.1
MKGSSTGSEPAAGGGGGWGKGGLQLQGRDDEYNDGTAGVTATRMKRTKRRVLGSDSLAMMVFFVVMVVLAPSAPATSMV